jgi:hypothetical protein
MIGNLLSPSSRGEWTSLLAGWSTPECLAIPAAVVILFWVEHAMGDLDFGRFLLSKPVFQRWCSYYSLMGAILLLGNLNEARFIYFQF